MLMVLSSTSLSPSSLSYGAPPQDGMDFMSLPRGSLMTLGELPGIASPPRPALILFHFLLCVHL